MNKQRWESVKQVEWTVKTAEQFGRKVATADEAREIMKIGVWYESVEYALFKLVLSPNPAEGGAGSGDAQAYLDPQRDATNR